MKWPRWRPTGRPPSAWLLALLLIATFGPVVASLTAQPASRLALTAAISEHHTIDIGGFPLGVDRATYNGHLRSDKAPGQPLVAVPVYLVGRALGAESAATVRQRGNLGAWWVTLWTSFLPFVALVVLMYRVASRHARTVPALGVALGLGVGSMMLPLSVNLYGAALAAVTAYGAWMVVDSSALTTTRLVGAGALAGVAVAVEYETAIVLAVLALVVIRRANRRVAWFALGAAGPFLVLGWYQWAAFGAPWRTAHAYYATAAVRRQIVGYHFGWRGIDATLFGAHGLVLTNPIVLVGLVAAAMVARSSSGPGRRHAMTALAVAVPYLVLCAVWRGTPALEEPGPRYLIPAIPFLAVPIAVAWDRLWRPVALAAVWGAVIAIPASVTFPLLGIGQPAVPELSRRFIHGEFLPTIWSMAFGQAGIAVYAVCVAVAGALLTRALRREARAGRRSRLGAT